jgi:hypothetical protein
MSLNAALGFGALIGHTGDVMWDEGKRRRLDELRIKEAQAALADDERAELAVLFAELDAEEALALRPAMERVAREIEELRVEKARVDERNRELERVIEQQESLLAEVRAYAGRVRVRRAELADELRRLKAS